jgi:hypothetical protein
VLFVPSFFTLLQRLVERRTGTSRTAGAIADAPGGGGS